MIELLWSLSPADVKLGRDEVHVWCASLTCDDTEAARLAQTLDGDEKRRLQRLRFAGDRHRLAVRRGILRTLLGRYLALSPGQVPLGTTALGKPILIQPLHSGSPMLPLRFSVSHSDGLALYAISCASEIGVDVERLRPVPETEQMATLYFSEPERRTLFALPAGRRAEGFLQCWTRKEAYVKATGRGLQQCLRSFAVTFACGEPPRVLSVGGEEQARCGWALFDLRPAPGFAAALAVAGRVRALRCWQWRDEHGALQAPRSKWRSEDGLHPRQSFLACR